MRGHLGRAEGQILEKTVFFLKVIKTFSKSSFLFSLHFVFLLSKEMITKRNMNIQKLYGNVDMLS